MFETPLTRMLGIQYPILQGGLHWLARAELVSAVSEAGGLGILSGLTFPDRKSLQGEIRRVREMTKKPFGVNLSMLPELAEGDRTEEILDVLLEEKVAVVETSGRSPEPFIRRLKQEGIRLIHKVPSVRFARKAEAIGADAVTIVGFECGGHPGMDEVTSMVLIPKAVQSLRIPVIAGGGICDARGFVAALALGAQAVVMGTRFLLTHECPIHPRVKERLLQATETDTMIIQRSIRNAVRALRNRAAEQTLVMEERGASLQELMTLIRGQRSREAYLEGDFESGIIPCGQCIGLIDGVKAVREVIEETIDGAKALLQRLNNMANSTRA